MGVGWGGEQTKKGNNRCEDNVEEMQLGSFTVPGVGATTPILILNGDSSA